MKRKSLPGKRTAGIFAAWLLLMCLIVSISRCTGGDNLIESHNDNETASIADKYSGSDDADGDTTGSAIEDNTQENTEYTGLYILRGDPVCSIRLTITKDKNGYSYIIKGDSVNSSGSLTVEKSDNKIYFRFMNTMCSGKYAMEGLYTGSKIVIQNYGNASNSYVCLNGCDSKYLEFVKTK